MNSGHQCDNLMDEPRKNSKKRGDRYLKRMEREDGTVKNMTQEQNAIWWTRMGFKTIREGVSFPNLRLRLGDPGKPDGTCAFVLSERGILGKAYSSVSSCTR